MSHLLHETRFGDSFRNLSLTPKDSGPDQTSLLLYFIPNFPEETWAHHFENNDDPFLEQTTGPSLYDSHLY